MRVQSLIAGGVASVVVVSLGAIATIAARLPERDSDGSVPVAMATRPLDRSCGDCGVVTSVKEVQLKDRGRRTLVQYEVRVRMSNGSLKTLTTGVPPHWKAGDRVRLQNGRLAG